MQQMTARLVYEASSAAKEEEHWLQLLMLLLLLLAMVMQGRVARGCIGDGASRLDRF